MKLFPTFMKSNMAEGILTVAFLFLGVAFAVVPLEMLVALDILLGILFLFYGVSGLVKKGIGYKKNGFGISWIPYILATVLGLFYLIAPASVVQFPFTILGLYFIFRGIENLLGLRMPERSGLRGSYRVVYGIVSLITGLLMLMNPIHTEMTVLRIIGVLLVIKEGMDLGFLIQNGHFSFSFAGKRRTKNARRNDGTYETTFVDKSDS